MDDIQNEVERHVKSYVTHLNIGEVVSFTMHVVNDKQPLLSGKSKKSLVLNIIGKIVKNSENIWDDLIPGLIEVLVKVERGEFKFGNKKSCWSCL